MASAIPDPLDLAEYIAHFRQRLRQMGIEITLSRDFAAYDQACATVSREPSPYFSLRYFDLVPSEAFWLAGRLETGETVHLQAMRVDRLQGMTLAALWQRWFERLWLKHHQGSGWDGTTTPIAEEITGTVVYHGDVWVDRERLEKKGLSGPLAHLAQGLALANWNPDFVYGFVDAALAETGFSIREGYANASPFAVGWVSAPVGIDPNEAIVYNAHRDLMHLTRNWLARNPGPRDAKASQH